jgi:hypothetical protein
VATALGTISEIDRELARRRVDPKTGEPIQRTSVMTHIAWVPMQWVEAAEDVLAGLAERHPSRTIRARARPDAEDGLEATPRSTAYPLGQGRMVCVETIRVHLNGSRAEVPASVVQPLLLPDLPVFLRWRGLPPFGERPFEELVDVVDRLIVDSTEWPELQAPYAQLVEIFDRGDRLRHRLGAHEPLATAARIALARDQGRKDDRGDRDRGAGQAARGLAALAARARRRARARAVRPARGREGRRRADAVPAGRSPDPADLLSDELDRFTRDRVYEDAVRSA